MANSEHTAPMTTLRLLEPRALAAADRFGASVVQRAAPLLRSLTAGALGWSERLFHYWIGRNVERPPSARARRGPSTAAMSFPAPWYDEPASATPARGMLRAQPASAPTARRADLAPAMPVLDAALEPRAIELIASWSPAAAAADVDSPAAQATPASPATAAVEPPPRVLAPRPSLVARILDRLASVDGLLHKGRLAPAAAPILTTVREPAVASGPLASTTPSRFEAAASAPAPLGRVAPPVVYVEAQEPFLRPAAPRGAASMPADAPRPQAVAVARGNVTLDASLPIAVAWPRVQRFLEALAGPSALAHAGVITPTTTLEAVAERSARAVAPLVLRTSSPLAAFASADTAERGPRARAVPPLVREWVAPELAAPLATATNTTTTPAARAALTALTTQAAVAPTATAIGELRRAEPLHASARFEPGRLAQQAELLGRIAETRVARQLGFEPEPPPRSVRWSSDAFTFITPDVFTDTTISAAAPTSATTTASTFARTIGSPTTIPSPRHAPTSERPFVAPSARSTTLSSALVLPALATLAAVERAAAASSPTPTTPGSIASLLAFVDTQVGARLGHQTRALPVAAPAVVYVEPLSGERAVATTTSASHASHASHGSTTASERSWLAMPAAFDAAPDVQDAPIARTALRSEQIAGEVGLRIGALSSEFLVDPAGNADAGQGYAPLVPQLELSQRPFLTTQEWVLLSMFPSVATAQEVAASAARRSVEASSLARETGLLPVVAPNAAVTGARGGLSLASVGAGLRQASRSDQQQAVARALDPVVDATSPGAMPPIGVERPAVAQAMAQLVAPSAVAASGSRAALTQRLPDGRAPRGSRLFPRIATPVVATTPFFEGGAPTPVLAGSEAAERRVESPVGAPLWGHLRPVVAPLDAASEPRAAGRTPGAMPTIAPPPRVVAERRPSETPTPRSVAMDLIAPFVEAARSETSTASSSFSRSETPVVSGRAPDDATRSLVTALASSQSGASGGDRLTLADLTLISFVSAAEQVAAAGEGATPVATGATPSSGGGGGGGGGGSPVDDDAEIERIAEAAYSRLRELLRNHFETKGDHWER